MVAVSDAYLRATMTTRDGIIGRNLFDVFPDNPADAAATGEQNLRASLKRVLDGRAADAMAVQKYDIRRPDSEGGGFEERYWSPVNTPVLTKSGKVAYIIHRVEDVTEFVRLRHRANEQQKLAEDLKTGAGLMEAEVYRRAQQIQEANQRLRELQAELETRVAARTSELESSNEALRRSEGQLRQAQKLEAIGRLAGGVAHDFNNLLTVIMGHGSLLHQRLEPDDPNCRDMEEILRAADRAAGLTRQLLAFSRQQVLEPKVLDLNAIVTELDRMLRRLIGEDIDLVTATADGLGHVKADPGQVEQVLMNLVVNARDAMAEGGKLTIETANVDLDKGYTQSRIDLKPGRYVMLAVSDTGCGMSAETVSRIFEPFYTTKESGRGTGLGLSTVHGIVKQSDGHIEVYSELGQGTTFKVYLPRVEGATEPIRPHAPVMNAPGGGERILLVEDEAAIRRMVRKSLELRGYSVVEAIDGSEAISIVERGTQPLQLLITDVVMPLMSGPELAQRMATMRPDLRVLFVSGYTDRALIHQGLRRPGTAFLQKPFTPDVLAQKVREILDQPLREAA
jgi:signal transduction histidine kinase/ActR/RegA family two-component response regulator